MDKNRIQKEIASSGLFSRRKADELVEEGRVTVNGRKAILGDKVNIIHDSILIDGNKLPKKLKTKVILVNKPPGIICSCKDTHGRKTILGLLPPQIAKGLHPIGRLDFNSRGAILLTNNGELTLRLTHPKFSHSKTYLVWVKGVPTSSSLNAWRRGIELEGKKTLQAKVELIEVRGSKALLKIKIREGRNRQIRKIADF